MKTILIAGSSRGIGKAVASLASNSGYQVILHGKTESDELKKTASELPSSFTISCDVANKEAVIIEVNKVIEKFGKIDALVNCAGIVRPKPFLECEDQDLLQDKPY
ncbi:hypothetical protein CO178_02150 [candidate division WWE3 bacterium CG_4_9_14_3_um_filter_34_6]|uniref:3-oxoacyl-ACP reductase n=1 Tax=candidate division WWE3 bacterium CG_4_9_14_3_um_filter_34_6 TaxID=1975079 RepID=A0A2M7X2Q0_UNCKA|nr:MAG: hypothetical protein CO178_02150 [candidate division WWE3 bacterium CG_4_9_14_3_um_filter_34_6]